MVKEKITSVKENCGHRHSTCKWPGMYFESCLLCKKRDDSGKLDFASKLVRQSPTS